MLLGHWVKMREEEVRLRMESYVAIKWFARLLNATAHTVLKRELDLRISVNVTCLCVPEDPGGPGYPWDGVTHRRTT